jgi:hypothetical protein
MSNDPGPNDSFPKDCLSDDMRRFTQAGDTKGFEVCVGDYPFAPGAETLWSYSGDKAGYAVGHSE